MQATANWQPPEAPAIWGCNCRDCGPCRFVETPRVTAEAQTQAKVYLLSMVLQISGVKLLSRPAKAQLRRIPQTQQKQPLCITTSQLPLSSRPRWYPRQSQCRLRPA
jgi:hypothetical protein